MSGALVAGRESEYVMTSVPDALEIVLKTVATRGTGAWRALSK